MTETTPLSEVLARLDSCGAVDDRKHIHRLHQAVLDVLPLVGPGDAMCTIDGRSILHYAAFFGWRDILKHCLSKFSNTFELKLDVDAGDAQGDTPLHLAAGNGHNDCATLLLSYGADPDATNLDGMTCLHAAVLYACDGGDLGVVETLLQHGASGNIGDHENGFTPLHYACMAGKLHLVCVLCEQCRDIDVDRGARGNTGLHFAASGKFHLIYEYLTKKQYANIGAMNDHGHTPAFLYKSDSNGPNSNSNLSASVSKFAWKWGNTDALALGVIVLVALTAYISYHASKYIRDVQ